MAAGFGWKSLWVAVALALAPAVHGQDMYSDAINAQMAQMNAMIANGQQQVNAMVQQKMRDPSVQRAYQQYLAQARARGMQAQDYASFTYGYLATRGYSREGTAAFRQSEAANQAKERAAYQGYREAQANRAQAQADYQNGYFRNQQEAGNQLLGNSTFMAPNGTQMLLPHTWQANSTHRYQGNTYHVDPSGNYWVAGADGNWYPLTR